MKSHAGLFTIVFLLGSMACSKKAMDTGNPASGKTDTTTGTSNSCSAKTTDILNMMIFPADNAWNQDISAWPTDAASSQILAPYAAAGVKADFGSGLWNNAPIGIPFVVVCGSQQNCPLFSDQIVMMAIMVTKVTPVLIRFL